MGLTHIKGNRFISKQIQVQAFPRIRALIDKQELLKGNSGTLIVHEDNVSFEGDKAITLQREILSVRVSVNNQLTASSLFSCI